MVSYVTLAGKSSWALINSYYCSLRRGIKVTTVRIVIEKRDLNKIEFLRDAIEEISRAYGMNPEVKTLTLGFPPSVTELKEMLKGMDEIILDITAGRKSLVMMSMVALGEVGGTVVYLSLLEESEAEKPHMMIPLHLQRVIEVKVSGVRD